MSLTGTADQCTEALAALKRLDNVDVLGALVALHPDAVLDAVRSIEESREHACQER